MPEVYGDTIPGAYGEAAHGGSMTRRFLYALCAIAVLMIIIYMVLVLATEHVNSTIIRNLGGY
jgi:hypothetical protein